VRPSADSTHIPGAPSRERIAQGDVRVLHRGGRDKADLLLVDLGDGPFVLKDFSAKRRLARWLGRIQVARESAAYRWLAGVEGVPGFFGRVDPWSLAIEYVEGERLADAPISDAESVLVRLRALIDRLHERGVVHNDLRSRENLLLDRSGRIFVVDLAGALRLRPRGFAHRVLFRVLEAADEAAYLRWKERLAPASVTAEERAAARRFARLRALWPFNRKRRKDER
jgi:tRNA A-37 threonylcarbamoyl transferase component Bud32